MLQCEPLAVACSCWGTVHGGERRNRRGGAQEVGKRGGLAWVGSAYACSRRWCGYPDAGVPSGRMNASAAVKVIQISEPF
jgi:hypothetical protein